MSKRHYTTIVLVLLAVLMLTFVACDNSDAESVTYTVTVDGVEQSVVSGNTATKPQDPTPQLGYQFDNWYSGDKVYDWSSKITSNTVIEARYTIADDFDGVDSAEKLLDAVDKGRNILLSDNIELSLSEALVIDYSVTIAGADHYTISVTRSDDFDNWHGANDNIVVKGNNAVIDNITLDFSDINTGYGLLVGYGGGKGVSDSVDGFTITNSTIIIDNTNLSALYFGDSAVTGDIVVAHCTFDGGSVAICGSDITNANVEIYDNIFVNNVGNDMLLNYFWIYTGSAENVVVNFYDNTMSGKLATSADIWLGNGIENHLAGTIEFASSGNTVILSSQAELDDIASKAVSGDSNNVLYGTTYVYGDNSYTLSDWIDAQ